MLAKGTLQNYNPVFNPYSSTVNGLNISIIKPIKGKR